AFETISGFSLIQPTSRSELCPPSAAQVSSQGVLVMSSNPQLSPDADTELPDSTGLRLLAVHAHPDDEASKGAAMMAAYVHAGARVMVATATDGSQGDIINPHYGESVRVDRDITAVRFQEMA